MGERRVAKAGSQSQPAKRAPEGSPRRKPWVPETVPHPPPPPLPPGEGDKGGEGRVFPRAHALWATVFRPFGASGPPQTSLKAQSRNEAM